MDKNHPADSPALQVVIRGLVQRYDWALLSEEALVEAVLSSIPPGASESEIRRQARHCYITVLYKACHQTDDQARRERAFHELSHYLFRAAYNRWPDMAEDVTQRALILVCEQIDRCEAPGTFLAFALWKLRHAFQQELKVRKNDDVPDDDVSRGELQQRPSNPSDHVDQGECLRVLLEAIQLLPDIRKQKAIVLKFIGDLSDDEIAERLEVSVSNVRVLRHRGLRRLRKDRRLRNYFKTMSNKKTRSEEE